MYLQQILVPGKLLGCLEELHNICWSPLKKYDAIIAKKIPYVASKPVADGDLPGQIIHFLMEGKCSSAQFVSKVYS